MQGGGTTTRHVRLVMGPHGVLDACVGVDSVAHSNVAISVARLTSGHGGDDRVPVVDGRSSSNGGDGAGGMILVVGVGGRWRVLPSRRRRHLRSAIVTARGSPGRVVILLPVGIHCSGSAGQWPATEAVGGCFGSQ